MKLEIFFCFMWDAIQYVGSLNVPMVKRRAAIGRFDGCTE